MEGSVDVAMQSEEDYENEQFIGEGLGEEYEEGDFDVDGDQGYGSEQAPLGGIYSLFNTVLQKKDATKVSNLTSEELGSLGISVRESMRIALLGKTFGHPRFAKFFDDQAGIVNNSSMSRDGWFTELFVTSKKYASKDSHSSINSLPQAKKGKWKMFTAKDRGEFQGR